MTSKAYLIILKTGVFLALGTFLLMFRNLLFPYITSKQITFNILIEILTILWIAFIVKFPEYRPKKSWITFGLLAYLAAILASAFAGIDFNLSFWGDVERMLGLFHVIHFFFLYLIIITVMREKKDWFVFANISLSIALIISLFTFKVDYSTIGNTAYVAGYLLFNIYFAAILFFNNKNWAAKSLYVIAILFMLSIFWKMHNSGGLVGLGVSSILALLIYGILNQNKKLRIASFSAIVFAVLILGFIFGNKNSDFVKNNEYLRSLTTMISSNKITFQTRLISWNAALKDFPNHPIFGTGFGNYAITFDKYFDPKFYNFMTSDTYFDRAHNNLVDITSTAGVVGLLAYLSIFAAVAFYLISGFRSGRISLIDFSLLAALVTAYFIYNLAIFDSLVTYVSLMMTLGFIYFLNKKEEEKKEEQEVGNWGKFIVLGSTIVILFVMYMYNIRVYEMLDWTIEGQRVYQKTGDLSEVMTVYKKALSYETPLDRDGRTTFTRLVIQNQGALNGLKSADKNKGQEAIDYAIELIEKNLALNPNDSLQLMEYSQLLTVAAAYNSDDSIKANNYLKQAEEKINRSIALSPGRIPPYFNKAQVYLTQGRKEDVINTLKYAIDLNPKFADSHCQLSKVYFYYKNDNEGYKEMDACLDNKGGQNLYPIDFVKSLITHYNNNNDFARMLVLFKRYTELEPGDVSGWVNLAKLQANIGNNEEAIKAAEKAIEIDPSVKNAAEEFIKGLEK